MTQEEIDACLVEHGLAGRLVVRLKGGDPFVFGRGGEEAQALSAAGVPFEVVPGITSAIAAPAYAGIPVTHRGVAAQIAIVTGHERPGKETSELDWDVLARFGGTLVFLMGVGRLAAIADALIAAGKDPDTPTAVVASGTLPAQRTVTGPLHRASPRSPRRVESRRRPSRWSGPVAGLRDGIAWAEASSAARPHDRRDARSRAGEHASSRAFATWARAWSSARRSASRRSRASRSLGSDFDLVCVTSPNTPRLLLDRLGGDARALAGCRVAAIGPGTAAALRACGIVADVVAERSVGEGLVEALGAGSARCPCAGRARGGCTRHAARGPARRRRPGRGRAALPHAARRPARSRGGARPRTSWRSAPHRPCATSSRRSTAARSTTSARSRSAR